MLKSTLRRGALSVGIAALGLLLSVSSPADSFARGHRSGRVVRKASHSAHRGRRGKSHSAKYHHVSRPLIGSEKEAIIAQLHSITGTQDSTDMQVSDDSLIDSSAITPVAAIFPPIELPVVAMVPLVMQDATVTTMFQDSVFIHEHLSLNDVNTNDTLKVTKADIVGHIIDWFGTKYVFGGTSENGIDCSAFTRDVFRKSMGVDLPRTAAMQSVLGQKIERTGLQFGDMVFFKTDRYAPVTHVGIYMGDGYFANSQCSRGVTIASLNDPYWGGKFLFGKRLYDSLPLAKIQIDKELDLAIASGSLPADYHKFD